MSPGDAVSNPLPRAVPKKMSKDDLFRRVAEATACWLQYQEVLGRQMLLSESFLASPIGEVLVLGHNGEVEAEFNHPTARRGGRGRPRQVDYVLMGRNKGQLVAGLEVKWVADKEIPKGRIVADLLRLERLRPVGSGTAERYLMVAGRRQDMQASFLDVESNAGGGRKRFLDSFLATQMPGAMTAWKSIDIQHLDAHLRKEIAAFAADYDDRVPARIRTRLLVDATVGGFRAMAWKVDSGVGRRRTFAPTPEWARRDGAQGP